MQYAIYLISNREYGPFRVVLVEDVNRNGLLMLFGAFPRWLYVAGELDVILDTVPGFLRV